MAEYSKYSREIDLIDAEIRNLTEEKLLLKKKYISARETSDRNTVLENWQKLEKLYQKFKPDIFSKIVISGFDLSVAFGHGAGIKVKTIYLNNLIELWLSGFVYEGRPVVGLIRKIMGAHYFAITYIDENNECKTEDITDKYSQYRQLFDLFQSMYCKTEASDMMNGHTVSSLFKKEHKTETDDLQGMRYDKDNGNYVFDFDSNFSKDIIYLNAVKKSCFKGNLYYFGYRFNPIISSKEREDFIAYLKGINKNGNNISDKMLRCLIERPLAHLKSVFDISKVTGVVYPLSNRSSLVKSMVKITNEFLPHHIKGYSFELVKKIPTEISFDFDSFERDYADNFNYKEMLKHVHNHIMPKIHSLDYFSIARDVKPKFRPYISDYFNFFDLADIEKLSKLQHGENILVIDDINTTGSTINEILRILTEINPAFNIFIYTLIGKE